MDRAIALDSKLAFTDVAEELTRRYENTLDYYL